MKSLFDAINLDEMGEPLSQQAAGEGKHDVQRQVAHTRGRLESPNSLTSAFLLGGNLKEAHAGEAEEAGNRELADHHSSHSAVSGHHWTTGR